MRFRSLFALGALALASACSGHGTTALVPQGATAQSYQTKSIAQSVSGPSLGLGSTIPASIPAAPAGWAATLTQAVPLSGTDLGALSPTQAVTVRVGLQLQNVAQLKSEIASAQVISPSSFASQFGPSSAQVSAVSSYLQSQGFTNVTVEPDNVLVSADGTAAQAAKAFDTTLHSFSLNGSTVFANVTPAYVPSSLGGVVVAVLGLNNVQSMAPPKRQAQPTPCNVEGENTPSQECLRFYDPATFQIAYDAPANTNASHTTVAVMSWNDPSVAISYVRQNEQAFKLPQANIKPIQVGLASGDNSAADTEWTLDMTYSSGIAQQVQQILIYHTTAGDDSDIALAYSKWVTQHLALTGNSSFGECEAYPYLDGAMLVDDELFAEGAVEGQTMFVSTGDTGGFCPLAGVGENGVPAGGALMVNYPASSPYVVAVGGTDLFSNADGTYKGESGWESGGGGISQFEYGPSWETNAQTVNSACAASAGCTFRGIPDVAMDASLETGALLWGGAATNGSCTPCVTGGTSLASPLTMGSYARMQTAHGNRLGFAAPLFYNNYYEHTAGATNDGPPPTAPWGGFHLIMTGTNGVWTANPTGYSYLTGLGSLDISVMNSEIGK